MISIWIIPKSFKRLFTKLMNIDIKAYVWPPIGGLFLCLKNYCIISKTIIEWRYEEVLGRDAFGDGVWCFVCV